MVSLPMEGRTWNTWDADNHFLINVKDMEICTYQINAQQPDQLKQSQASVHSAAVAE
jgi:hypothetical protein